MTDTTDAAFQSITGALESAEPASASASTHQPAPSTMKSATASKGHKSLAAGSDSVSSAPVKHNSSRSFNVSGSPSPNSPLSSRDASPARPHQRTAAPSGTAASKVNLRSRQSNDASPSRGPSLGNQNTAPAAALPRALSTTSIPQPSPTSMLADPTKASRPLNSTSGPNSGDSTPHWPISPRLRSPPPPTSDSRSGSRSRASSIRNQAKKIEAQSTPAIVVQSSSPAPVSRIPVREEIASDSDEPVLSMKGPSRGASGVAPKLETVQESSLPATPGFDNLEADSFSSVSSIQKTSDEERNDASSSKITEDLSRKNANNKQTGSGSDTGTKVTQKGKMQEQQRSASTQRPAHITSKPSLSSLSSRSTTQPSRNMTVETETIPSVAQSTLGTQDRSTSGRVDGSLRLKPSNETIRPKKERKAPKRKAPSINSGTASTKADVFEQKVASAVDEANSSDSEATFIYDSAQPEQQPHRSRHHHSRTPSMTSIASLADPRLAIRDSHKNPGKKSSMKFANPYHNPGADQDVIDRGDGTIRAGSGRMVGGSHHHHISRHGQGRGALSHLIVENDSSTAQPSRARGPSSRQTSQPNSPRYHTFGTANGHGNGSTSGHGNKTYGEYSSYDLDIENIADDERTPLITSRSPRLRTPRRRNSITMRLDRRRNHIGGIWDRCLSGVVIAIIALLGTFVLAGIIFTTTKPLQDVKVRAIQNVVVSQEELILDLVVDATNLNIVALTVSDMDVSIFAKSKHVGSDKWWRHHGSGSHDDEEHWQPADDPALDLDNDFTIKGGVDEGTDPINGEPRTMSLGRLFKFDSALVFDSGLFTRRSTSATGEIRLLHPGNKTEAGGSERWEEVLQYPFELIVRGALKYQLPLSSQYQSNTITATYNYDPSTDKKKLLHTVASKNKELEDATLENNVQP